MTAITPFNNLRLYYLNPTSEGEKNRKELANQLAVKTLSFFFDSPLGSEKESKEDI